MKKLMLCMLLFAARAQAQVPITELPLTPDSAAAIAAAYNAQGTTRLTGDSRVAPGSVLNGNVAILEGALTLGGQITGNVVVINGDATFESGARIDGSITIIGGTPHGVNNLTATHMLWYRERLKYELRDGELFVLHDARPAELA